MLTESQKEQSTGLSPILALLCKAELDAKQGKERRKALQQLFQDFEDQIELEALQIDDRISVSSTELEEQQRPEEIPLANALRACEEDEERTPVKKEAEQHSLSVMLGFCQSK